MNLTRRGLIGALICAPAVVRASSLMAVKPVDWGKPLYSSAHPMRIGSEEWLADTDLSEASLERLIVQLQTYAAAVYVENGRPLSPANLFLAPGVSDTVERHYRVRMENI